MRRSWVGIGVAIICVNIELVELGFWILGASLTWLGFSLVQIRESEKNIRLGILKAVDSDGQATVESEGIQIKADRNEIIKSKIAPDYSFIKGTVIFFKYETEADQLPSPKS